MTQDAAACDCMIEAFYDLRSCPVHMLELCMRVYLYSCASSAFHTIHRLPFGISFRSTSRKPHFSAIAVMLFGVLSPREGCMPLMYSASN